MKLRSIPILRNCIIASFVLLTYITVTYSQRSISFYDTDTIPPRLPLKQIVDVVASKWAFAALTRDGSIVSWGSTIFAAKLDASVSALTNVKSIFAVDDYMYCAIAQDDTMYCWGLHTYIAQPVAPITNAKEIFVSAKFDSTGISSAYAVLRKDGSVVTWGDENKGGDSSSVASELNNVKHIAANDYAFAAIRENGSVVTWGKSDSGGDSSSVSSLLVDVVEIVSTKCAFAAVTSNGDVVSWGCSDSGGSVDMYRAQGVKSIHPIHNGFLGVRHNGSVVGWGTAKALANSNQLDLKNMEVTEIWKSRERHSEVYLMQADGSIAILTGNGVSSPLLLSHLSKGVKTIVGSKRNTMYIAVKYDGSTVAWHNSQDDSIPSLFEDVEVDSIYSFFDQGFVAVTNNNRVITRANDLTFDSEETVPNLSKLAVTELGVVALTRDGDVKSWPLNGLGSIAEYVPATNVKDVRSALQSILYLFNDGSFKAIGKHFPSETQITRMSIGVSKIFSNFNAFAALLKDGTVVAWGKASRGGDASLVADKLNNVKMVYHNHNAFAAVKYDGSVVTWGDDDYGGDSGSVAALLQGVTSIVSVTSGTPTGFSAITGDRVISWGEHFFPSNNMKFDGNVTDAKCAYSEIPYNKYVVLHGNGIVTTGAGRITGVKSFVYSGSTYALLLNNGEVVYENPEEIVDIQSQLVNVKSIHSVLDSIFVALKHDHTVVLWRSSDYFDEYYDQITQYLGTNTVFSIQTTRSYFVAVTRRLDRFVDEYAIFNSREFIVVKDCMCELEVHDEFILETSFRPTASPTSSPTVSPTSSPTSPTDSQLQENDKNSENLSIGIGVGTTAGLVIVAAMVAYRKYFPSSHQVDDFQLVLEKSLSSDNPSFQA